MQEVMTGKIIAVVILCIIVMVQFVIGVRTCKKEKLGCLGVALFAIWTVVLLLLFWLAGVFDFN